MDERPSPQVAHRGEDAASRGQGLHSAREPWGGGAYQRGAWSLSAPSQRRCTETRIERGDALHAPLTSGHHGARAHADIYKSAREHRFIQPSPAYLSSTSHQSRTVTSVPFTPSQHPPMALDAALPDESVCATSDINGRGTPRTGSSTDESHHTLRDDAGRDPWRNGGKFAAGMR